MRDAQQVPAAVPASPSHWQAVADGDSRAPSSQPLDCRLTLQVRQELLKDALLAPLNVGVSVHDHIASLWGAVPSADLARRAAEKVRHVQGIADVINELQVEAVNELPRPMPPLRPLQTAPAPEKPVTPEPSPKPGSLTGGQADPAPAQFAGGTSKAAQPQHGPVNPQSESEERVALMPSIVVPPLPPAGASQSPSVLQPRANLAAEPRAQAAPELSQAIERLRQSDPRFSLLRPEINGGLVHLHGQVANWDHAVALAHAISKVPGVQRVVLGSIQTGRAGRGQ